MNEDQRVAALLPLPPLLFQVMLVLGELNLRVVDISDELAKWGDRNAPYGAAEISEAIRGLTRRKLVEESPFQTDPENHDDHLRYYSLTLMGLRVAEAEARRLAGLVLMSVEKRILSRGEVMQTLQRHSPLGSSAPGESSRHPT